MAQESESIALPARRATVLGRPLWLHSLITFLSYAVLILFAIGFLAPFFFAIANSFKTAPEIAADPLRLIPKLFTWENYQKLQTQNANVPLWTRNSLIFAVVITLGRILLDSMAGYALARLSFPGRKLIFLGILATMMIPAIVLLIPKFIILKQFGLLATYQGAILPMIADAFGIFLMKQFFESVPTEIEEAARIDGASPFQIFFQVTLPMATPALTALTIFSFQGSWNELLNFLVAIGPSARDLWPLTLGLGILRGGGVGQFLDFGLFLAGSLLMTLPMAIIFVIFQRYFVESQNYAGVKG
ncbi:MAG: carbohydrate ABC transporter permease [Rudaea sp.]